MGNEEVCEINNDLFEKYTTNESQPVRAKTLAEQTEYEKHKHKLNNRDKIFNVWNSVQTANTNLRNDYAIKIFWLLVSQAVVVNLFVLVSILVIKDMTFVETMIKRVILKSLMEIGGFLFFIIKYLFNPINNEINDILEKLKLDD